MWQTKIIAVLFTLFIQNDNIASGDSVQTHISHREAQLRINNGMPASENWGRYMVYLITRDQMLNTKECGGTLITLKDILTARYCVLNLRAGTAYIGAHSKKPTQNYIAVPLNRDKIVVTVHDEADLGLIRLPPLTINRYNKVEQNIRTIHLPQRSYIFRDDGDQGQTLRAYGWGRNKKRPVSSLEYMDVTLVDCDSCRSDLICTTTAERHERTCNGDTGGPLIVNSTLTGEIQIGVVAFTPELKNCQEPYYSHYVPIHKYYDWIKFYSDLENQ